MTSPLVLSRPQILGFRRRVGALDERLPAGRRSLRQAAWAGLQDSMPRAALLSIHARVEGAGPSSWEDTSLVQLWGPRFQVYVIAARDHAVFSLGRFPNDTKGRQRAEDLADRLHAHLDGGTMTYGEAGHALGVHPNALRYAAPTGTVLIRWAGARLPTIWTVPPAGDDPLAARLQLACRHLHVFGPTTPAAFARWAGISARAAVGAFDSLRASLTPVRTPLGEVQASQWDEIMALNLRAPFLLSQAAAPHLRRARGVIVNIADLAAFETWPGYLVHGLSKSGVVYLTRALARVLAPGGVRAEQAVSADIGKITELEVAV